jgi:hypothetical protein
MKAETNNPVAQYNDPEDLNPLVSSTLKFSLVSRAIYRSVPVFTNKCRSHHYHAAVHTPGRVTAGIAVTYELHRAGSVTIDFSGKSLYREFRVEGSNICLIGSTILGRGSTQIIGALYFEDSAR